MTRHLDADGSAAEGDAAGEEGWTAAERDLLEAALDFYGAAEGVIDYTEDERPQLRHHAAGFDAVRRTMAGLEERIAAAHAEGMPPARIAQIARIEQEMVELILQRRTAPRPAED